jgi:hypothetical protein
MVTQQQRCWRRGLAAIADELRSPSKTGRDTVSQSYNQGTAFDRIGQSIAVTALGKRGGHVEQRTPTRHNSLTANRVVWARARGAAILWNSVSAIKRIVKAAPARVRSIERITGIRERHHELRSGNMGDLFIHVPGANGEVVDLRQKITDLAQKTFVVGKVQRLADPAGVISVDARLETITNVEQLPIAPSEIVYQIG